MAAAALAGPLTGAVGGALDVLLTDGEGADGVDACRLRTQVLSATELVLRS
ncbi:hypothetical protein ACFVDQ_19935 [Streptomyces sp. NPDC057684]|uniref:hypothetical protein n=1 Tax=Streptomyces sp. NPDC057684 TaxID=3346211 RepID=UPI0036C2161A